MTAATTTPSATSNTPASPARAGRALDVALAVVAVIVAALFLPKVWLADSALYQELLTEKALLAVGCACKLASLVAGAVCAVRAASRFDAGSAMRAGWSAAALWFVAWSFAQAILGVYQLVLDTSAPFPSVADPLFCLGYAGMLACFVLVVKSYAGSGLVGAARAHVVTGVVAAVPFAILGFFTLAPVLREGGAPLELALNIAYPALDIAALVPVAILARIALLLRGGALFWVWAAMSLGIVFMVAGDLLYAWFSILDVKSLDPLLDLAFIAGYALAARAAVQQARVTR